MVTRLTDINSFLLNGYIDEINKFVGEKVISHTNESVACNLDYDTFEFMRKLAMKIFEVNLNKQNCIRNCCFRKRGKK